MSDICVLDPHRIGCSDGRGLQVVRRVIGDGAAIDGAFIDPRKNVNVNGNVEAKGRHRENSP